MKRIVQKTIDEIEDPQPGELGRKMLGKTKRGTTKFITLMFWPCQNCGQKRWVGLNHYAYWLKKGKPREFCFKCTMTLKGSWDQNPSWKGGRANYLGYSYVHLPKDHPFYGMTNSSHFIGEHRLVMAQKLGRLLKGDEFVHHINGNRSDNRPENLEITTNKIHCRIHKPEKYKKEKRKVKYGPKTS